YVNSSRSGRRVVDLARDGAYGCQRSAKLKRANVGRAIAQIITLILRRRIGIAGIDRRTTRKQRAGLGRPAIVLQALRVEFWIEWRSDCAGLVGCRSEARASVRLADQVITLRGKTARDIRAACASYI